MKIGIIAASGKAGALITKEAVQRGHEVTAIVRHPDRVKMDVSILQKDLFDLTTTDLENFDVVVDAFRATEGKEEQFLTSIEHLVKILTGTSVKLFVVGGAGSLYVDDHITHLYETPTFPEVFKPTSIMMGRGLEVLENQNGLNWTYISPAADFKADGPKKGHYVLGNEMLMSDANGKSEINYADYAIAMLDEIETGEHNCEHLSVVW